VVVTPRAADDTAFYPAASPPERFAVLFAGDIGLRKGLPYLLEAWDRLALPGAELWLAGRVRSDGRFLAERYGQRDDVRFPGHVADMPALYRQASICVLPSLSEGSAKVLYEAMASGLPIVYTTACGAVAQNGVEGIQVPARDVDALALAIERLYQDADLRRAMGQAGVRLMAEYTWEHARARWLRLYHSLLAE
jgi:glycosyltransferase involved in cell wall biosynthesis